MQAGRVELPWLLRTWRTDVAGLTQPVVAESLAVSESAVSMWENGRRRPAVDQIEALDALYDADNVLVDLTLALRTPNGLPARHTWAHNPQGPSRPRWAWLRPRPGAGRVAAWLRWGAFGLECAERCDDWGVFVTASASMPNPAAWIHLREPGWVDFGRGEIPAELGIPMVDALARAEVASGGHSAAGLVAPEIVDRFIRDRAFAEEILQFFGSRPDLVREVFSTTEGWNRVARLAAEQPAPVNPHQPFTGPQYRTLREARGLSQADAASLVTGLLPSEPVTDDQIGVLERGGSPRPRFLRARLDTIYRADGYTCVEQVAASDETRAGQAEVRYAFSFPTFWIGPVWIIFTPLGRFRAGPARLEWGGDIKHMLVDCPAVITCRRAFHDAGPLFVFCPIGWKVTAGMGSRPEARDVNFGWVRDDDDSSAETPVEDVNEVFLSWFGRTKEEFAVFLHHHAIDP